MTTLTHDELFMPARASGRSLSPGGPAPRGRVAQVALPGGPSDVWAVILAGGEGQRLQRFVRDVLGSERPKQFCRIVGRRSMLRHTWDRATQVVEARRLVTVITAGQVRHLDDETGRDVPGHLLVQPENKDTAAGLLLPLLWIHERAPLATVVVFPADHFVWEEARFAAHVRAAVASAALWPDRLVLLGVEATGPEAGYGWIAPGMPVRAPEGSELYTVRRFWEKPDQDTAARLFAFGRLWNTLILAGSLATFLRLADDALAEILGPLRAACGRPGVWADPRALAGAYREVPCANVSRALLARRPERLLVLPARDVYWSDWGDPDRILRTLRRFDRRPAWVPRYLQSRLGGRAW